MLNFCLVNMFNYPKAPDTFKSLWFERTSRLSLSRGCLPSRHPWLEWEGQSISPPPRLPLGMIPIKILSNNRKITSARGAMGRGKRRALRLFSLPIVPQRAFFNPSPQPPYDTKRHLRRREGQSTFSQLNPSKSELMRRYVIGSMYQQQSHFKRKHKTMVMTISSTEQGSSHMEYSLIANCEQYLLHASRDKHRPNPL